MTLRTSKGKFHLRTVGVSLRWCEPVVCTWICLPDTASFTLDWQLKEWIYDDELAESVFEEVPKRYADKEGSYVKITRLI